MLPYFKGYTIAICVIAVAFPLIASSVWPLYTGQIMASTLDGLVLLFALFIFGMMIGYAIFSKLANSKVQSMLDAYNTNCDPEKLIQQGAKLASQASYPCNQAMSWFMGYFGQALLDSENVQEAKNVLVGLRLSIDSAKKPKERAGILVNYLSLEEKMEGSASALSVIEEGLGYCSGFSDSHSIQYRDYLNSQKEILDDLVCEDVNKAIAVCEKIRTNSAYPMRLRVEYAWIEASKLYGSANKLKEISCLNFIVENGNKLAMVSRAKTMLQELQNQY